MARRSETAQTTPTTRTEILARADELASLREAGDYLHVDPKTVRRLIAQGKIQGYRIGNQIRVRVADLDALLVPVTGS